MKKALTSGLILTGILSLLILPVMVSAQIIGPRNSTDLPTDAGAVTRVIYSVADWLFAILIIGAVIVILIAAFTFLTSAGDAEKVKTARNYVVYALVALVVAFLSRALIAWFTERLV